VKTLTLFNALCYAQDSIEEIKIDLAANGAGMPADEHARKLHQLSRLVRQRITFKDAIRARLASAPRRRVHTVSMLNTLSPSCGFHRSGDEYTECGVYWPTPASYARLLRAVAEMELSIGPNNEWKVFTRKVQP
jgi:hypothetical protein